MQKIIEFKDVKLAYGKKTVLRDINLDIYKGDFIGIVGPNGSGKTTILRALMGLVNPVSGEITRHKNVRFGYCMQRQFIDTIFPFTVFEIVMMARARIIGIVKGPSEKDKYNVTEALKTTGISHLSGEPFKNLSGGQKQRVILARALAVHPDFLVLDEPTADLDIKAEKEILDLIASLQRDKKLTVLIVTHELNEVINRAGKFIFLNNDFAPRIFPANGLNEKILSDIFNTDIKLKFVDGKMVII